MSYEGFREMLRQEAAMLAASAARHSALSQHKPSRGTAREAAVADALRARFPMIEMLRGEVMAPGSGPSSEWDVILHDPSRGAPLAGEGDAHVVPIETVVAVVSVKSQLGTSAVVECAGAAVRLRGLVTQEFPEMPLPAVFAFGFEGVKGDTLSDALADASTTHGAMSRVDGLLVLGQRLALPSPEGYAVSDAGPDAYGHWIAAIDFAVERAPRSRMRYSHYLGPEPSSGAVSSPFSYFAEGSAVAAVVTETSIAPESSSSVPETATDDVRDVPLGLATRPAAQDLGASRMMRRVVDELRAHDSNAAIKLSKALESRDALVNLAHAEHGRLLAYVAAAVSVLGEMRLAAAAFERASSETDGDESASLLARAAITYRAADEAASADAIMDRASDDLRPGFRLARASLLDDATDRVTELRAIQPALPWEGRFRDVLLAKSLYELDREPEAEEAARKALQDAWSLSAAELLVRCLMAADRRSARDPSTARQDSSYDEAIQVLDDVAHEALTLGHLDQAMIHDGDLVRALARRHRHPDVDGVVGWWTSRGSAEARSATARAALASALLGAHRQDLAVRIAPGRDATDETSRLLWLQLDLGSSDPNVAAAATQALDRQIEAATDDQDALALANIRATASLDHGAPWSDRAAEILGREAPFYRDQLLSSYLARRGDSKQAETILLAYADTLVGRRALIDVAVDAEDWERVVTLVEDTLGDEPPPIERLRRADALEQLERHSEAETAWRALAEAGDTPTAMREHAWYRFASSLATRQQWDALAKAAVAWSEACPESSQAAWAAAESLARIGDASAGLELLERAGERPESDSQRRLVARLIANARPITEALERIARLSDEIARRDETLEAMLITLSIRVDFELDAELERRLRSTFAEFPERFPESAHVQSFSAPSTAEGWSEFAERHLGRRERWASEILEQISGGSGALSLLAVLGRTSLEVWIESRLLPLVTPLRDLQELEVSDADAAIARAASWDGSVLAVLSLLPEASSGAVRRALPGSVVPRAIAEEVEVLGREPDSNSAGTLGWDPDSGRPTLWTDSEESVAARTKRIEKLREIARTLAVLDPDVGGTSDAAGALRSGDLHHSAATWLGALVLAIDRGIPFFCDDRYLRRWARQQAVPAFGTAALLEAMRRRGVLTEPDARTAVWTLRGAGGRYLRLEANELAARVSADDFEVSPAVDTTLLDPDGWLVDAETSIEAWDLALRAIWKARPSRLAEWIAHLVTRLRTVHGRRPGAICAVLLSRAALGDSADSDYCRALLAAFSRCERVFCTVENPVDELVANAVQTATATGSVPPIVPLVAVLSRLPMKYQLRVLGLPAGPDWRLGLIEDGTAKQPPV
ncbi:hypothetical protein OJ997_25290 [Solirubrobacter phytolaccae]|uniref:Uncharacterized protein n=1 Tax=Solirubrobacter phytolaccae TaxID=1404360 RepID=A0A9X3SAG5_9ACTN|nr:DUF6602 domain-containing protein [Solirubrobacter phytolaccae]MDA0183648.1 hypothetical protein [Solirubrobacter phytolaccae]